MGRVAARIPAQIRPCTLTPDRLPWVAALLALIVVTGLGAVANSPVRPVLPAHVAIADSFRAPQVQDELRGLHWTTASASALDQKLVRVDYLNGPRLVAESALDGRGRVVQVHQQVPYGSWIAYEPAVLVGLGSLFVLMTGVAPLRRLRNLDVAATLSLMAPVVLLQQQLVTASVLAALPGLTWLLVRCARLGLALGPPGDRPAACLYDVITKRLGARERGRLLRLLLASLALLFVLVGVSSAQVVDVAYAVMEGATKILHGVLPYGHLPGDVIHGDTYPILSYLAYVPAALIAPVNSTWDSIDVALALSVAAALVTAGLAGMIAVRARPSGPGSAGETGVRAALGWLSYPPLLIVVSTGTSDVLLVVLLAWALLLWRRPAASGALLSAAGWFKLAPFALLPVWLASLRGGRLLRALGAILAVSAVALGTVLLLGGISGFAAMAKGISFQLSRGSPQSIWAALGIGWLRPLGEGSVAALAVGAAVRVARGPGLGSGPARLAAVSAAILIAAQLAANYWSFLYTIWVLPLLGASLLAPVALPAPGLDLAPARRRMMPVRVAS